MLAAVARQAHLNNSPGTEYLYSNSNFVLGAIIIERASRQPLNAFSIMGFVVDRIGNAPTRVERAAPWRPSAAELSKFIGSYHSSDIDGVQRIVPTPTGLAWVDPSGTSHPLTPIYGGAFEATDASWTFRFRPGRGDAMALAMSIIRARQIAFTRLSGGRRTSSP